SITDRAHLGGGPHPRHVPYDLERHRRHHRGDIRGAIRRLHVAEARTGYRAVRMRNPDGNVIALCKEGNIAVRLTSNTLAPALVRERARRGVAGHRSR